MSSAPVLALLERLVIAVEKAVHTSSVNNALPQGAGTALPDTSPLLAPLTRIADVLTPPTADVVGTDYIAKHLGCTGVWVSDLARRQVIPANCVVPGSGHGSRWKFYRAAVDRWLASRR
jgi:hypothetical protein